MLFIQWLNYYHQTKINNNLIDVKVIEYPQPIQNAYTPRIHTYKYIHNVTGGIAARLKFNFQDKQMYKHNNAMMFIIPMDASLTQSMVTFAKVQLINRIYGYIEFPYTEAVDIEH